MKLNKLIAIATISLLSGGISMAQKALNLEDIVAGNIIQTKGIGSMTWLKDGERYSRLENNKQTGGTDIVAYRAKDNSREVIIPSSLLTDKSTGRPIPVRSVSWSADNEKVLIYNNTRRVWRYDTRGDYWVLNLKDGALRQLGKGMPESSMMFAKFSPDGTRVAYVSNNNIYVEDIDSGKITQLTKDGSDTIVNGTFDWVYEEEFSCRDGFRWSPDGKHIAYWQSDTKGTGVFDIINNVDSINYLPRMEFIPESDELFIQQLNRPQNTNKVWIAKISDNSLNNIFTDTDAAWLDTNDNIQWLKDNHYFTWESERSGWRHLYRISRDGKEIQPITKGDFDYISPVGTDLQKGWVYFIASPDNFTQRYLYRAKAFGNGEVERVSPMEQSGQHRYNMSPTGKWAIHAQAKDQYAALGLNPKEFIKVKSGNLTLDAWMIKPVDFDASKKYPVIIEVYGEPASATVQDVWGNGDLWQQYMANQGYIVVSIENRGANTPRGREWRKCIYGEVIWPVNIRLSMPAGSALPDGAAAAVKP